MKSKAATGNTQSQTATASTEGQTAIESTQTQSAIGSTQSQSATGSTQRQTGGASQSQAAAGTSTTQMSPVFFSLYPNPVERLRDPEVQKFFLGVLNCDLPAEAKYRKFVEFFELDASLSREIASRGPALAGEADQDKIREVVATAAEKVGVWNPQEILTETEDSVRRAVRRLLVSQHRDGGWGFEVEVSHIWATVYGVLALYLAEPHHLVADGVREACERGLDWLLAHRQGWSAEDIPPDKERSIYELSAVIRCLCETRKNEEPAVQEVIAAASERLQDAQNDDGGWDRSLWGTDWPGRTRIWSETGATSFALQALAAAGGEACKPVVAKGMDCLARAQNEDGSWNVMLPRRDLLDRGPRSVTKTCDALKGILLGGKAGIDMAPYKETIARGVEFLQGREQPIFDDARTITGWGWYSEELSALENTCHTLETLLLVEDASLPLLTSNASWLIQCQYKARGSLDDGKWTNNETGRIALALLHFYRAIKASPLFASATGDGD
jgi:hypothetical protein